ncbi:MAG: RsmE family RNA methyltransferase [Planctomycetota bacterium]
MSSRFFVDPPIGDTATLDGAEAHHLLHVMRAKVGDALTLFDGSGVECSAVVTATRRSEVDCSITQRAEIDREPPFELTLGVAMPKGDRQKVMVEKLTELGVTRLVPLVTERSVAEPKTAALDKLRRAVIEASKQCGRNRLMAIDAPCRFASFVESLASADSIAARKFVMHPTGQAWSPQRVDAACVAAIGPEGGFTDDECRLAISRGWATASLGPRLLRVETAAIATACLFGVGS